MKKNEIVELKITDITSEGNGVGRYNNMAVFIPETCIGDIINAKIVKVLKNYAYGIVHNIITPSSHRITPDCPVFSQCGGCSFRHMNYDEELTVKNNIVLNAFSRIGKLNPIFLPIEGCLNTSGYRNKAQYPVADKDGKAICGFYAKRSHRIIPYIPCSLLPAEFHKITEYIIKFINENNINAYNEIEHKGILRHIYLRKGFNTEEIMLCLVCTAKTDKFNDLALKISNKFPAVKSIVLNINPDKTNVIMGKNTYTILGENYINDILCGNKIRLSPESFYQVNSCQAEKLYKIAEDFSQLTGNEHILDLYCGTGTIGLSMSSKVKKLTGVEIISQAIKNAEQNVSINNINNSEFICGDAAKIATELAEKKEKPDVIFLDPPRKGCSKDTINAVINMSPKRIIMISCNPSTAARDCSYFNENGYDTIKVKAVDLFPRTVHVECVCLMTRNK